MSIGGRLRQARLAAGLTATELGSRSGFTGSHISQIERGVADPSFGALTRICAALHVEMSQLFLDDRVPPPTASAASAPSEASDSSGPSAPITAPAPSDPSGRHSWVGVVKAHERATIARPGSRVRHELLCPDLQHNIEAFRTILPPGRLAFVGHDLVESGYQAADYLARVMKGTGSVIITTTEASWHYSMNREKGARRAFAQYPGIRVLQTVDTGSDPHQAAIIMEKVLRSSPTVTGVCALDCFTVQLSADYVNRHNPKGRLLMVGFDEVPASLELVRDGTITAVFAQAAERQAYEAVRMLVDFLHRRPICSIDTGVACIDASNIDEYLSGAPLPIDLKQGVPIDPSGFNVDPAIAQRVASGQKLRVALSYVGTSLQLASLLRKGVERAAAEFDVEAFLVGPPMYDVAAQVAELEDLVAQGIDGLAISSGRTDPMTPVIDRLLAKGIPVITFNSDNPESGRLAFVGLDHSMDESDSPTSHEGEEWAIVVDGILELVVAERSFVLNRGDAIHFDSSSPHYWRNIGSSEAEIVWVASPPHF